MSEFGRMIDRKPPEDVRVTNWPSKGSATADYFRVLERRYKEFQRHAEENQLAVMRYYTPRGELVYVFNVSRHKGEETILLQGEDQNGNPCEVVVQPQSAQVVLKLLTFEETKQEERKPIGFRVID